LCTGNFCRSPAAGSWTSHPGGDRLDIRSAGIDAHGKNPRAIAAIAIAVYLELSFAEEIVSLHSGAISQGHPIDATGPILTSRPTHSMNSNGRTRGVLTHCIGGGKSVAVALDGHY